MNTWHSVLDSMNSRNSMYLLATIITVAGFAIAVGAGCTTAQAPDEDSPRKAERAYKSCASDSECGDGLACVGVMGSDVCVASGCVANPDICAPGETCVSGAMHEEGVCALTGPTDFCSRQCSDPMRCSLDPECVDNECCGTLDEGGCPSVCAELETCTCVSDPRCPEVCCNM